LDRWWETPENENDEMPEKITSSPKAVENTQQWIRSSQQPNENTSGKNRKVSIAKKPVNKQNNLIVFKILYFRNIITSDLIIL